MADPHDSPRSSNVLCGGKSLARHSPLKGNENPRLRRRCLFRRDQQRRELSRPGTAERLDTMTPAPILR
jgi:hypothetical protein